MLIVLSKFLNVDIDKPQGWYYVGRFVFSGQSAGVININITGINLQTKIFFYSDQNVDWQNVYKNRNICQEMINPGIFTQSLSAQVDQIVTSKMPQPSFWYIGIANCDSNVNVKGVIHIQDKPLINTKPSYDLEFDYSQQYQTEIFSILIIAYCGLFSYQFFNFFINLQPKRHVFQYIISICVLFLCLELLFQIGWDTQQVKSNHFNWLFGMGQVFGSIGQSLLIIVIILMGQGWLISNEMLERKVFVYVLIAIQGCANFALMVYTIYMGYDDPQYAYALDSPVGITYNIVMFLVCLWFMINCMITRHKEIFPERKALYLSIFIIFSSSLLSTPLGYLFGLLLPNWFRFIFVLVLNKGINLVSIIVIIYLTSFKQVQHNFSVNIYQNNPNSIPMQQIKVDQHYEKHDSDDLGGW